MLKSAAFAVKQQNTFIIIRWLQKMSEPWVYKAYFTTSCSKTEPSSGGTHGLQVCLGEKMVPTFPLKLTKLTTTIISTHMLYLSKSLDFEVVSI